MAGKDVKPATSALRVKRTPAAKKTHGSAAKPTCKGPAALAAHGVQVGSYPSHGSSGRR